MAKKEITGRIRLQIPGGQATPAPPVGPALGQHGVPIGEFIKAFNDRTGQMNGTIVTVDIDVYADRTFGFDVKSPPAAVLLKQAAGIVKGSPEPNREKVGQVTMEQVRGIVQTKMEDLNADDVEQAAKMIAGTARSMGLEVVD